MHVVYGCYHFFCFLYNILCVCLFFISLNMLKLLPNSTARSFQLSDCVEANVLFNSFRLTLGNSRTLDFKESEMK